MTCEPIDELKEVLMRQGSGIMEEIMRLARKDRANMPHGGGSQIATVYQIYFIDRSLVIVMMPSIMTTMDIR